MNQSPQVSVIIPNYNYAEFLGQAIDSVLAQTYRNFEIIVVNNGSTDNSLQVLSKYKESIVLVDQSNQGQSGARNSGIIASSGELIAFLDADDFWEPTKLEKQLKLVSHECQLIYCGIQHYENETGKKSLRQFPHYKGNCQELFSRQPGVGIVIGGESTVIITRDLLNIVGNFNIGLSVSSGWDFYRRCANYTHFDYVPELLTNYRIHNNNMSKDSLRNIEDIRKSFFVMLDSLDKKSRLYGLMIGYFKLEINFVKTHLRNRYWGSAFCGVLNLPFHMSRILVLRLRRCLTWN
jgi:glycosyltransferase involved in cell wall biosynthesis